MKVAVIGGNGQLGADVVAAFREEGDEVVSLDHADVEVTDAGSVFAALEAHRPDVIVNTAAMHNVNDCEARPQRAFEVNGVGPLVLGRAAQLIDSKLIHVSTDYVFDGRSSTPYQETDRPAPLNVYGASKLSGEYSLFVAAPRSSVVRTSALYGSHPCRAKGGLNFVEMMLSRARTNPSVKVVTDEMVTPTYTVDLARQIVVLSRTAESGIFHATSQGSCTWNEFARAIFATAGVSAKVEPATQADFPNKVARPAYSVLDNARLRSLDLDVMPAWDDALSRYLERQAT